MQTQTKLHGHDTGNRDKHMLIHTTDWEAKAHDAKRRTWDHVGKTQGPELQTC